MKPIVIHPGSALAGAAVLALVLFGVSAAQESSDRQLSGSTTLTPVFPSVPTVLVQTVPRPEDIIVIKGDEMPYTVPSGKAFVVTAFGSAAGSNLRLEVDGVTELTMNVYGGVFPAPAPRHYVAPENSQIETASNNTADRIWGYLIDA